MSLIPKHLCSVCSARYMLPAVHCNLKILCKPGLRYKSFVVFVLIEVDDFCSNIYGSFIYHKHRFVYFGVEKAINKQKLLMTCFNFLHVRVHESCHSTVVRVVDWQSRGCQFESCSLLYKCYWRGRHWLTTS